MLKHTPNILNATFTPGADRKRTGYAALPFTCNRLICTVCDPCCGFKYIEFGSGSRVIPSILKEKN